MPRAAATAPTLNLNALQIRDGSEQLYVGGRKLVRDVDYRISYDVGQVTFINPDELFGQGSAQVQARFEERGIFAVAPTTILGMSTRYALGDRSSINLIGLYQREESAFNRPALGFEATANLIGGANTQLQFRPQGITRFLNSLTSSPTTAPSVLDVNAEIAFSKPDPNRSGEAYLEEFESEAGLQVPDARGGVGVRQRAAGGRGPGGHRLLRFRPRRRGPAGLAEPGADLLLRFSADRDSAAGYRPVHPAGRARGAARGCALH